LHQNLTAIALTSGLAGHETQCIGVIERLGLVPEILHVKPTLFEKLIAPYGKRKITFETPPALVVAAGRQSVAFAREIKRQNPATIVCILQDPRCSSKPFDLVWVNNHDKLKGENVIRSLTSPHRLTHERLKNESNKLPALPAPTLGVLIGGESAAHHFTIADAEILATALKLTNHSLYITASRRTGKPQIRAMKAMLKDVPHTFYDGETGENPYFAILGKAEKIVVTSDSTNMLSEAAFTGKSVYAYPLTGKDKHKIRKFAFFYQAMLQAKAMRWFTPMLETYDPTPLDSTGEIADILAKKLGLQNVS
jgi:uncharacterized protein